MTDYNLIGLDTTNRKGKVPGVADTGVVKGSLRVDGNSTISGNEVVQGDLTVNGTLTAAILTDSGYQGTWNASTNSPTLTSSVGTQGHWYLVDTAGSTTLNGVSTWAVGDVALFNGSVWQKIQNSLALPLGDGPNQISLNKVNSTYTNSRALARAIRLTAATSASTGIQIPSNIENNPGFDDFTPIWQGALPDYTPAADVILLRKHDGTNGYILSIRTTGVIRLQLNGFNYDSTVAITTVVADFDDIVIDTPITRETATAAGSVRFNVNGVQLGDARTILSEPLTPILDLDFSTDPALVFLTIGAAVWNSGPQTISIACVSGAFSQMTIDPFPVTEGRAYKVEIMRSNASGGGNWRLGNSRGSIVEFANSNGLYTGYAINFDRNNLYLQRVHASGDYSMDIEYIKITPFPTSSTTVPLYLMGTSTTTTAGKYVEAALYNRSLSALDSLRRVRGGPARADLNTSNVNIDTVWSWENYAGTMETLTTSGTDITSAINSSGIGIVVNNGGIAASFFTVGKAVEFSFDFVRNSGSVEVKTSTTKDLSSGGTIIATLSASGRQVIQFTPTVASTLYIGFYGLTAFNFSATNFRIREIGQVARYPAENAQGNNAQIFDDSGNKFHGVLPASRCTVFPANRQPAFRSRHTWASTSEEQYITRVNQNVVPDNCYFEGIVVVPTGSTLTGFTIGNGSNSAYYATVAGPVTAGQPIYVSLDRRFPDANRKLTIKPLGTFDGTLSVTAAARILETA